MKPKLNIAVFDSKIQDNYTNALLHAAREIGIKVHIEWFSCAEEESDMTPRSDFRPDCFDGLLLPGGGDIDPAFYGETIQGSIHPDAAVDRCQLSITDVFVKSGKPILGICRGHQLINIYFGGSLHQDIPEKKDHVRLTDNKDNRNIIKAIPGSFLYEMYGEIFAVNSSHHQAVNRVGTGLTVVARCLDGTIEALAHDTFPIYTVQFHPERMDYQFRRTDTVAGGEIFKLFLQAAARDTQIRKRSPRPFPDTLWIE